MMPSKRGRIWFSLTCRPPRAKCCRLEAGPSTKPTTTTIIETRARTVKAVRSPEAGISSAGIVRKILMSLRIVGSCRIRRKEMVRINRKTNPMVMVRPLLSPLLIVLIQETFLLFLLVVLLVVMNGYLILHARFIYAITEIGSVLTSLCKWRCRAYGR